MTSDGCAQKLGNDVRRDSESIATKVCRQIGRKWNAMCESHVATSVERTTFDNQFEDYLSNLPCKHSSRRRFAAALLPRLFGTKVPGLCHCQLGQDIPNLLCYWPTIHNSISKICPKCQVICSHFFKVDELLDENWAKIVQSENISTPIYVKCDKRTIKGLRTRILVFRVWSWYSTWTIL